MTSNTNVAGPFVKYAGGKTQLFEQIASYLPLTCKTYREPNIGGGAMFFGLAAQNRFEHAIISDTNSALIAAYTIIRDEPEGLINTLREMPLTKEFFDGLRKLHPDELTPMERAAWILFLNKTCFNGLYRVNKAGFFNVPWGKYKNPNVCNVEKLLACSAVLQKTTILHADFEETTRDAVPGDVVYFDPPYIPLTKTSNFTGYQADGFGQKEQERLATHFAKLADRGVHVVLSNSDTEMSRQLYAGFEMHVVQAKRNVNNDGTKRGPVNELIVVGNRT